MRVAGWSMLAASLAMVGCKDEAPAPPRTETASASAAPANVSGPQLNVLAFGDSLFAGYGLADAGADSYPAQLEQALREAGRDVRIANAGVSGDTTAAGRQRLAFTLDNQPVKPDLVLLELGGNDLLRGLPTAQTRANLDAMLTEIGKRGIPVVLLGLQSPPNAGPVFGRDFDAIYPELAKAHGAAFVPFVTAKVFGDPNLIQADHVHPTAQGVEVLVAATKDAIESALPAPATAPEG